MGAALAPWLLRAACASAALFAASALPREARADEGAPETSTSAAPSEAREAAAARFSEGEEAFLRGAYAVAAARFEQAHAAAAHHDAAWNAAEAWERGHEPARAATWLAIYLEEAPPDAPDRAAAKAKLEVLTARLARVEVRALRSVSVAIDGWALRGVWAFASPGSHRIDGGADGRVVASKVVRVASGDSIVVDLEAPTPPAPSSATPKSATPKSHGDSARRWSPFVVVVGGAVTAGLGATTLVLGAATERAHDEYASSRSQAAFDDGQAKQDLTNGFFWATVAAGALTAASAIFLVDWKRPVFAF